MKATFAAHLHVVREYPDGTPDGHINADYERWKQELEAIEKQDSYAFSVHFDFGGTSIDRSKEQKESI